jgi:hypothetical protein
MTGSAITTAPPDTEPPRIPDAVAHLTVEHRASSIAP